MVINPEANFCGSMFARQKARLAPWPPDGSCSLFSPGPRCAWGCDTGRCQSSDRRRYKHSHLSPAGL